MDCAAEDGVAAEETREERVVLALFAVGRGVAEEEHGGFVDEGEEAEVAGVLAGCFVDEEAFGAEATTRLVYFFSLFFFCLFAVD